LLHTSVLIQHRRTYLQVSLCTCWVTLGERMKTAVQHRWY